MPSASITLYQGDVDAINDKLGNLHNQAQLMKRIGRAMHSNTLMNFKRGHEPNGTPWLPLKIRKGQPLRDTGRLMRSITWESNHNTATIGTNVIYGAAHNFGIPGKLPARQFIGITPKQVDIINGIADQWLNEVLNG